MQNVVLDTNILISRAIRPNSKPGRVVAHVIEHCKLLMSPMLLDEVQKVLIRAKFDKYSSLAKRKITLEEYELVAQQIVPRERIRICRDPKDDLVLELAVAGDAFCIVTGDEDLLSLRQVRNSLIMRPSHFLAWTEGRPVDAAWKA